MATKKKSVDDTLGKEMDKRQTFNPLLNALRENDKKNLFFTNVRTFYHKTGFPLYDYYFGSVINIHNELGEIIRQEPRVGQAAGTVNQVIGNTGTGKSTLVIQLAASIIRPFEYANVFHYDVEQRMDISRVENISGLPSSDLQENGRYILKSEKIGLDIIQESIVKLYATKLKTKDDLLYNTHQLNEFGKEIYIYQPTVIIVDSVKAVMDETFSPENSKELSDAEKLRSNMEGARNAKTIGGFIKDILPLCKEANIIVYFVNHINVNVNTNAFIPPTKQQNYLKIDESIPGGKALLYYPFNTAKLIAKPSDDFTEESDGFSGHIVVVEPVKTSSNQSGNTSKGISFELVFSHKRGFDSLRSLILYGKDNGIIDGNKTRMKFIEDPSFTFSFKNIYKEIDERPIWDCIKKYIIPKLESHLPFLEPDEIKFDPRSMDY